MRLPGGAAAAAIGFGCFVDQNALSHKWSCNNGPALTFAGDKAPRFAVHRPRHCVWLWFLGLAYSM